MREGLPEDIINEYLQGIQRGVLAARGRDGAALRAVEDGFAHGDTRMLRARLDDDSVHRALRHGERLEMIFTLSLGAGVVAPCLIVDVLDLKGLQISGRRIRLPPQPDGGQLELRVSLDALLQKGVYRVRTRIVDAPSLDQTVLLARHDGTLSFEVIDDSRERFTGLFELPMRVEMGSPD